jgi:pilus assembly protein CpaF
MSDPAPVPAPSADLDAIRRELHERLLATFDFEAAGRLSADDLAARCRAQVESMLDRSGRSLGPHDRASVVQGVLDDAFRLGPLEPLVADELVTDIMVVAPDRVFVERLGRIERTAVRFRDRAHLMHVIHRIVRNAGRRIDERSPMVDARLPDGSRVNAIIPPIALDGPQLSIRRFPSEALGLDRLVETGTLPAPTAELLRAAVAGRLNIIISGGAGVGKTTMLNAASASIGRGERVVTIEDAAELRMASPHVVRLETRAANVEGVGEVTSRDLVRNALRMRPDRIVVGECRGAEAMDMLQAMNSGHAGSMTTLHANSARDALHRLESMLAMGGLDVPIRVLRDYVASAIDVIVQLARLPDGRRIVSEVVEVTASPEDGIRTETIHRFRLVGVRDGEVIGGFEATGVRPRFMALLESRGIRVDPGTFEAGLLGREAPG